MSQKITVVNDAAVKVAIAESLSRAEMTASIAAEASARSTADSTHAALATAHGLTANISAGLGAATTLSGANPAATMADLPSSTPANLVQYIDRRIYGRPIAATKYIARELPTLLAAYSLDETSGVIMYDFSGNGYHSASVNVVTGAPGIDGACYTFDGGLSYCTINSAGLLSALDCNEFTFSLWYKTPTLYPWIDGAQHYFLRIDSSNGQAFAFYNSNTNNTITANFWSNPTNAIKTVTFTPSTNWTHLAITISNGNNRMRLYINGVLQSPETALGTAWTGTNTILLGTQNTVPATAWKGFFDEVYFYGRELCAEEISALASATQAPSATAITFMAYGDSKSQGQADLTAPYVLGSNGYPRMLSDRTGLQEVPRIGVSGRTAATAQAAIDAELAAYIFTPYYILCNLGANDALALPAQATWKANYKYVLQAMHVKWATAQIYIMRPWRQGTDAACNSMATWIGELVADADLTGYCHLGPDERVFLKSSDNGASYTADGVHPNRAGHYVTAQQWQTALGL
jgi:lysophospholipase L1-like esterase